MNSKPTIDVILVSNEIRFKAAGQLLAYMQDLVNDLQNGRVDQRDKTAHIQAIDNVSEQIIGIVQTIKDYI